MERSGNGKLEIRYSRNPVHVLLMLKIINDSHEKEHYKIKNKLYNMVFRKKGGGSRLQKI